MPSMTGTVGVINFDRSVGGEFTKDGLANNGAPTPTRSGHNGLLLGDRPKAYYRHVPIGTAIAIATTPSFDPEKSKRTTFLCRGGWVGKQKTNEV